MYSGYDPKPSNLSHKSVSFLATKGFKLTYHDHQSSKYAESVQMPLEDEADQNGWCNNGNMHVKHLPRERLSKQHSSCSPSHLLLTTVSTMGSPSTLCPRIFGFPDQAGNGNHRTRHASA